MPDIPTPSWIDNPDGVRLAANVCASAGRFALDTEADSMYSYYHKVCLIQLSAGGKHFVIDPLALDPESLAPLWLVIADPELTMVMHGSDYDIRVMDRDYGARVAGLEDTQIMAQFLGETKTGLGALLEQEFGRQLDKRHQRADWGRRPLAPELVTYAAADTAYLIDLADRLRARLEELGRWSWAQQEFRRLEQVRHQPVAPDPLAFERLKGARSLKGGARDRMHELFEWREQQARRRDLPPFKILGNRQMLLLAEKAPSDVKQIARLEGLGPRFVRRWGREVVRRLQRPRSAPPRPVGERRRGASAQVRRRMQRLLEARATVAEELGLQPGLICPKALLESVAEAPSILDTGNGVEFDGWRFDLLRAPFRQALEEG